MIEYVVGNIFDSPAQTIVNPVNTVGTMGKGLALSFRNKYPQMFEAYRKVCETHQLSIGKLMLYYAPDHWILLFPTKDNWWKPSRIEFIEGGLREFVSTYADKGITSIAFPKLGCGNGGLLWEEVRPVMEKYLEPLPISAYIYIGEGESPSPPARTTEGGGIRVTGYISEVVRPNCWNLYDSLGENCVFCRCCSEDKRVRYKARIEALERRIKDKRTFKDWSDDVCVRQLQEANIAADIRQTKRRLRYYRKD